MTEFITISENGDVKSHTAGCDADPQAISDFLNASPITAEHKPEMIITVHFGSPMIAKRGRDYFDHKGSGDQVSNIIGDWLNNLEALDLAKLYKHVTGCDCKAFDDDNEADSFAYNMGG